MTTVKPRVLLVDDDPNILAAYTRQLRSAFDLTTALSAGEALQHLQASQPESHLESEPASRQVPSFAVIVSDERMPEMDGIELLSKVKDSHPDMVRIMLTGNADQQTAVDAINKGDIFRFLNKPCESPVLKSTIDAAVAQHNLLTLEQDLLTNTLSGSIRALAEVLANSNPAIFGRTARLMKIMRKVIDTLNIPMAWWMEPMVLMSQIGCVIFPDKLSQKISNGEPLATEDHQLYMKHPEIGAHTLENIPRIETIVEAIRYQEKKFNGGGVPKNAIKGEEIPFGARLLKLIIDFDHNDAQGMTYRDNLQRLHKLSHWYDPRLLNALTEAYLHYNPENYRKVPVADIYPGVILAENLRTSNGLLLVARGNKINDASCEHIRHYANKGILPETVSIIVQDS